MNMMMRWNSMLSFYMAIWIVRAIDRDDVGNANDFVDTALKNLREDEEVKKHIDPLSVPDIHDSQYSLRNMKVRGLSSLYRHGDCSLSYNGQTAKVVAEIAVKNVEVETDYSAKAGFFWINGDGLIDLKHLAIRLDISSTNGKAKLNSIKVVRLGDYSVRWIRGMSFVLNWLLKIISNSIAQNARQMIINTLENEGAKALGNIIEQYELPIY